MKLETLKSYIKNNLAHGFIKPSKSSIRANTFFDKKPYGRLRFCVDYWCLNNPTIKNRYPLPLVRELLDCFSQVQWFTKLDLINTYHQIKIREGDEWKTAFKTRYGYFEYQVILFGLINILAIFQSYINKILTKKLNDILIYIKSKRKEYVKAV